MSTAAGALGSTAGVAGPPLPVLRRIADRLDAARPELIAFSHALHGDPELSGEEHRAAARAVRLLADAGYRIDPPPAGMPTAFVARTGASDMVVAVCVEYDALPGIGHACGHNVNGAAALGAALALKEVAEELDVEVRVLGTPAEESTGGKIDMIEAGCFAGVAMAMMAHAAGEDTVGDSSSALAAWDVEYAGTPAHAAAAPHRGVNALDALTIAQTAIAMARQQLPLGAIVSLIVTDGGTAPNVIPDHTGAAIEMRAGRVEDLRVIQQRVRACLEAGALATGCRLSVVPRGNDCSDLRQDGFLCSAYQRVMLARGRDVARGSSGQWSTDMGNVSHIVPSIHPMIGYEVHGAAHHTAEFSAAGASPSADRAVMDAAYGLAAVAATVATDPDQRARLVLGRV